MQNYLWKKDSLPVGSGNVKHLHTDEFATLLRGIPHESRRKGTALIVTALDGSLKLE